MMENSEEEKPADATHFVRKNVEWKPFFRQALIASGSWASFFSLGLLMGSPTVVIPQMRREANSTAAVSEEMASWLSSAFCYSAIPWLFVLPKLAHTIGRKNTMTIICISSIITYLTYCFSSTPLHLLITEILIGVQHASAATTSVIVLTEYITPTYRGLVMSLKSASLFWGVWVANMIGTFAHWSHIPKFGLVCTLYPLTVLYWPESPHWLASKQRFAEARKAHRWLKGTGERSEAELKELIKSFAKYDVPSDLKYVSKEFYMPLFLSLTVVGQYHFSGKFVITVYALDIMKKIMPTEKDAYESMLILDGITVVSTYIGCILSKLFRRRTLFLTASGVSIIFLFTMSLYLYLVNISFVDENMYLSIFLLGGFSVSISWGPMIMTSTLYGELIPTRFKNICITIVTFCFFVLHGTLLKVAPKLFKALTMPGVFLFYAVSSLFCAVLMYIYLPETKDKTLLEIEEYFKDVSKEESKKLVKDIVS